jgi:DNA-directed RNA polymerase II subunit RPB2
VLEYSSRPASTLLVSMHRASSDKTTAAKSFERTLVVTMPYVREPIPVVVVFRALGFVSDRDILEHIVYDFEDMELMDLLKSSVDEALAIQSQEVGQGFRFIQAPVLC